jgi:hypothetical protein
MDRWSSREVVSETTKTIHEKYRETTSFLWSAGGHYFTVALWRKQGAAVPPLGVWSLLIFREGEALLTDLFLSFSSGFGKSRSELLELKVYAITEKELKQENCPIYVQ